MGFKLTDAESGILEIIREKISGSNTDTDIANDIFPDLRKIMPCDLFNIGLLEENNQRIEVYNNAAAYEPHMKAGYTEDIQESGSFLKKVFLTGTHLIINNVPISEQLFGKNELFHLLSADGILSCMVTPVNAGGETRGILLCGSKTADLYSERHAFIFLEISRELSYIIDKIYQKRLLDQNHQAYMEMLSFVSHELKSPTSSIITLGRTMAEGYYGKIEPKQMDILSRIIKKAEYLHAISDKYLNLSHFESNVINLHPRLVDFTEDIIEPVIELLRPQIEDYKHKLEQDYTDTVLPVQCDPDLLKIVILNLLSNGIRYGKKGGRLKISIKRLYKQFSTSVWNEGPGFSEQDKYLLFKKFSRLRTKELAERKGSGVGLYVSWKIIHMHGGRIHADSEQGQWANFTFELPQYMDICIV